MNLIKQLVQSGALDNEKAASLEAELKVTGKTEEELILEKGIIPEEDLFKLKSESLKINLVKKSAEGIPLETLELIPEDTAKYYKMIPLEKRENVLDVGMVYPEDLKAQEALKFLSRRQKFTYQVFLVTPTTFSNFLSQYKNLKREVGKALSELEVEFQAEKTASPWTAAEFERLAEEAPVTKIVAVVLRHAVEGGASDIHIEPTNVKLRVRFRLMGELHSSIFLPLKLAPAVVARIKILANLKLDEIRVPQDGRFSARIDDRDIDFRVSTFPTTMGEKVAIRVLDPTTGLKSLADMGLIDRNFQLVKKAIEKPYGLILSTGPTGSGKTTTLYAIIQLLNKEGVNIVTLEDPVEYFIDGINQSQVRPEIGYDFASGLRHVVRQDPNIIMVGEIRDEETAALATHAALTGHVVLSTLHTSNAAGVIPRLIDLGVKPYLIAPTLSIAMSQRLVRKLCPSCKKKIKPAKEIRDLILNEIENFPPAIKERMEIPKSLEIYEPQGCSKCGREGYFERVALFEILSMTDELANISLKEPSDTEISKEAKRQGMMTMKQDGILKVLAGVTTIEEVLRVAEEK
ncbi:MAG: GspE/PulE family protein [Candidatus Paceibacterota bacterium]